MREDHGFDAPQEAAEILTPFATAFRYPGDLIEPEATDVAEAIELAQRIVDFVSSRLAVEAQAPE
jgi:hypothetical protein